MMMFFFSRVTITRVNVALQVSRSLNAVTSIFKEAVLSLLTKKLRVQLC